MNSSKRPVSVSVLAWLYIAVGAMELTSRFPELLAGSRESILIELVELLAVVCGIFMLRGDNWARWLAVVWSGFHVILSLHSPRDMVIHSLLFAVIAWLLFCTDAVRYFRGTEAASRKI